MSNTTILPLFGREAPRKKEKMVSIVGKLFPSAKKMATTTTPPPSSTEQQLFLPSPSLSRHKSKPMDREKGTLIWNNRSGELVIQDFVEDETGVKDVGPEVTVPPRESYLLKASILDILKCTEQYSGAHRFFHFSIDGDIVRKLYAVNFKNKNCENIPKVEFWNNDAGILMLTPSEPAICSSGFGAVCSAAV